MDWIALIGAVGAGAVLGKLIDSTLLESRVRQREELQWFMNERLRCYSAFVRELRSYGHQDGDPQGLDRS